MDVVYDSCGRMKYHPFFHDRQGTKWSQEDLEYLCRFSEVDSLKNMAMALGRTETSVAEKICRLRENGKFEQYRNLNLYW